MKTTGKETKGACCCTAEQCAEMVKKCCPEITDEQIQECCKRICEGGIENMLEIMKNCCADASCDCEQLLKEFNKAGCC